MDADDGKAIDASPTEAVSAGYPAGTAGYPPAEEESGSAGRVPFWRRYGFDSKEEWLQQFAREQDRLSRTFGLGGKSETLRLLGETQLEDGSEVTPPPGGRDRRRGSDQARRPSHETDRGEAEVARLRTP